MPKFYRDRSNPSRLQFLMRNGVILAWQYLVLDIFLFGDRETTNQDRQDQFGNGLEYKILDATKEEWILRVSLSVMVWGMMARLMLDGVFRAMAIVFVATGISRTSDWPPLFGSVLSAYTLRGFWGKLQSTPFLVSFDSWWRNGGIVP
jgi:hypothetical protein